jgi:hypothetical protein
MFSGQWPVGAQSEAVLVPVPVDDVVMGFNAPMIAIEGQQADVGGEGGLIVFGMDPAQGARQLDVQAQRPASRLQTRRPLGPRAPPLPPPPRSPSAVPPNSPAAD